MPRKLKIVLTALPTTAGNTFTTFPVSLLKASARILAIFSTSLHLLEEEAGETAGPPPKTLVIASAVVVTVIERAVSSEIL